MVPRPNLDLVLVHRLDLHRAVVLIGPRLMRFHMDLAFRPPSSLSSPQTMPCPQLPAPGPTLALCPASSPTPALVGDCLQPPDPAPIMSMPPLGPKVQTLLPACGSTDYLTTPPSLAQDSALAPPPPHPRLQSLRVSFRTQFHPVPPEPSSIRVSLRSALCPLSQAPPLSHPPHTCHADAGELAYAVQARGLVAAGPR